MNVIAEQPRWPRKAAPASSRHSTLPASFASTSTSAKALAESYPMPQKAVGPWRTIWMRATASFTERRESQRQLRVVETVSLGEKRFVSIVQVDQKQFLIGGGSDGVALLTRLDEDSVAAQPQTAQPPMADLAREAVQRALQQAVPGAVDDAVELAVKQALLQAAPEAVNQAVPEAVQKAIPEAVQKAVPEAVQQAVPEAVQQAVKQAVDRAVQQAVEFAVQQAMLRSMTPAALAMGAKVAPKRAAKAPAKMAGKPAPARGASMGAQGAQ